MAIKVIIAEAAHDENGSGNYGYEGSKPGDQLQKHTDYSERYPIDDYRSEEVRFNSWYNKPWRHIYRPTDASVANEIAIRAEQTVRSPFVGYSQPGRLSYHNLMVKDPDPSHISVKCECDCSSMVNTIVLVTMKTHGLYCNLSGREVTAEMAQKYDKMCPQFFKDVIKDVDLSSGKGLKRGDILLGDPATHTAIVLDVQDTSQTAPVQTPSGSKGTVTTDLNLRLRIGTDAPIITAMPKGSSVEILSEVKWYQVRYNGKVGYCSSSFIDRA